MNVVYLVSVSDRINLFKVCTYLHLNCDDWFTQWQKEAGQQHGKSLPISSWDAAEEVVASAIYGGGLVCHVRRPIGYLHSIWVECKCAWVKITPLKYRIWAKCTGVWGKITPTKLAVFIKLYPTSEARMLHSKILPQTSKKFTQINLPYLWHFATL